MATTIPQALPFPLPAATKSSSSSSSKGKVLLTGVCAALVCGVTIWYVFFRKKDDSTTTTTTTTTTAAPTTTNGNENENENENENSTTTTTTTTTTAAPSNALFQDFQLNEKTRYKLVHTSTSQVAQLILNKWDNGAPVGCIPPRSGKTDMYASELYVEKQTSATTPASSPFANFLVWRIRFKYTGKYLGMEDEQLVTNKEGLGDSYQWHVVTKTGWNGTWLVPVSQPTKCVVFSDLTTPHPTDGMLMWTHLRPSLSKESNPDPSLFQWRVQSTPTLPDGTYMIQNTKRSWTLDVNESSKNENHLVYLWKDLTNATNQQWKVKNMKEIDDDVVLLQSVHSDKYLASGSQPIDIKQSSSTERSKEPYVYWRVHSSEGERLKFELYDLPGKFLQTLGSQECEWRCEKLIVHSDDGTGDEEWKVQKIVKV